MNSQKPEEDWLKQDIMLFEVELDGLLRWEDEGGQIASLGNEWVEASTAAEIERSNLRGVLNMQVYKVGDTVVHSTYGSGKIVAIDDKGLPGEPCFYYVIEGHEQTLWVPVEENGSSSLHLPISASDFNLLINILRSRGDKMSKNPYQRHDRLEARMQKASPQDLCLVIRDLTYRSHTGKLSSNDLRTLKHAQSSLLDEWELSLGTPREKAWGIMESILKYRR